MTYILECGVTDIKKNLLQTKILRLLVGSILVASVLIGTIGIINASTVVQNDSAQIMNLMCEEKVQEINAQLLTVKLSVDSVYHYAKEQLAGSDVLLRTEVYIDYYCNRVYEVLKNAADSTDSAMSVYLRINPDLLGMQKGVYLTRDENGELVEHEMTTISAESPETIDKLGWYYIPVANGGPTWLEPYWDDNVDAYMTSYIIPIFYKEYCVGVVGMDIELGVLREIISEVTVYEKGHAFLVSAEGCMIYHKDYQSDTDTEILQEQVEMLTNMVGPNGVEGKMYSYHWNGKNERLVFHRLMNGMYLAISAPTYEINMTRNALVWQLITVFLIVMTIAISFSTRLAEKITKPLTELTEAARKIAQGDWNTKINCDSDDETGLLAATLKDTMAELNKQVEHANKLAYSDMMTGLYNRHYMIEYCTEYAHGEEKDVGVVFCDLNRLKYVNDNFGHSAGDGLICGFADNLKRVFPDDMRCRMSGDEFLVIVLDAEETDFLKKVRMLRTISNEGEVPLAAIGYCYREKAKYIGEMMNEAEDNMYKDKKEFYAQFPMYKR